jgi:hypothetical protein
MIDPKLKRQLARALRERGRPRLPEGQSRSKVLAVKLRETELESLRSRAKRAGLALSAFVRRILLGAD